MKMIFDPSLQKMRSALIFGRALTSRVPRRFDAEDTHVNEIMPRGRNIRVVYVQIYLQGPIYSSGRDPCQTTHGQDMAHQDHVNPAGLPDFFDKVKREYDTQAIECTRVSDTFRRWKHKMRNAGPR